jgi:MYXO-CTERM domain-containing protein
MIGGNWTDTNIDSAAGGVAPGADCGALGQRHVVYTFSNGGSTVLAANTASQEAGHAWGLDHTFNCSSVMSYCGGGDGSFQNACDGLCESQCQGPNSAGCRLTHEMFCGEGNDQQNDHLEMQWIFGGNEPDMEPPTAILVEPAEEEIEVDSGGNVNIRAEVDDNYGGFGWKFVVTKDGDTVHDEPDYDRDVDENYRAALNLVGLEPGVYTVTIEVEDQFEHVASDMVTIYVGGAMPDDTGDSAEGGESGGADTGMLEDGGDEDDEDDEGEDDTGIPEDNRVDNSGCGCTSVGVGGSQGVPTALLLLLAVVGRRRKRT